MAFRKCLVVLFPGGNYSTDCPLLYYAGVKFGLRGYEKLSISYGKELDFNKTLIDCVEEIKNVVAKRMQAINFSEYTNIVFVSKSLGTVIAPKVAEQLEINVAHIFLTPLRETLPYISSDKNIILIVAGTKDKHLDAEVLKEYCVSNGIKLKQIEGVGHRLEVADDVDKSIELLKEIVASY